MYLKLFNPKGKCILFCYLLILMIGITIFGLSPIDLSVEKVDSTMFPDVSIFVKVVDFKPSKEMDFDILEDGKLIPFLNVKLLDRNRLKRVDIAMAFKIPKNANSYIMSLKNAALYMSKFLKDEGIDAKYHLFICNDSCKRYDYINEELRLPNFTIPVNSSNSNQGMKKSRVKRKIIEVKSPDHSQFGSVPYITKKKTKSDSYVHVERKRQISHSIDALSLLEMIVQDVDFEKDRQKFIVFIDLNPDTYFDVDSSRVSNLLDVLKIAGIKVLIFAKNIDIYGKIAMESGGAVFNVDKTMDFTEIYDYIDYMYIEKFELSYKSRYNTIESLKNHLVKIRWNSSRGWKEKEVNVLEPLRVTVGMNDVIEVVGKGAPRPDFKDPYRRFLSARDVAVSNARELLLETVKGVQISSDKTIGEMMVEDYIIDKNVRGFLTGAKITYESWDKEEEIYTVKMAVKLTGQKGLIKSIEKLRSLEKNMIDLSKDIPIRLKYSDKFGFSDSLIYADGYGLAKPSKFTSVSLINARRAAIAEAQKELLATVKGIAVTANTFISDHMISNAKIRTYLNDILMGAEIVEEKVIAKPTEHDYGLYKVRMAVRWDGGIGLYNKISEYLTDLEKGEIYIGISTVKMKDSKKVYTGLIIDATGLGIKPAIFPKILDESGKIIYTYDIVEDDVRRKFSIVEYKRSLVDALWSDRVGDNPLIVGVKSVKNNGAIIILDEKAVSEILKSIIHYNYLKDGRVVIVTGRP